MKPNTSKGEAIRKTLERNYHLPAVEVVNRLAKKGIETNVNLVNSIRYRMKQEGLQVPPDTDKLWREVAQRLARIQRDSRRIAALLELLSPTQPGRLPQVSDSVSPSPLAELPPRN